MRNADGVKVCRGSNLSKLWCQISGSGQVRGEEKNQMGNSQKKAQGLGDFVHPEDRDQTCYPQHSKSRVKPTHFDNISDDNTVSPVSGYAGVNPGGTSVLKHSVAKGLHSTDGKTD